MTAAVFVLAVGLAFMLGRYFGRASWAIDEVRRRALRGESLRSIADDTGLDYGTIVAIVEGD